MEGGLYSKCDQLQIYRKAWVCFLSVRCYWSICPHLQYIPDHPFIDYISALLRLPPIHYRCSFPRIFTLYTALFSPYTLWALQCSLFSIDLWYMSCMHAVSPVWKEERRTYIWRSVIKRLSFKRITEWQFPNLVRAAVGEETESSGWVLVCPCGVVWTVDFICVICGIMHSSGRKNNILWRRGTRRLGIWVLWTLWRLL